MVPLSVRLALNYATPIVLIIYFFGSIAFTQYRSQLDKREPISRRRKICLISLASLVTLSYAAQAVQYLPRLASAPDDGLIHSISQLLLWISFSLILLEQSSPSPFIWTGIAAVNLIFEILISAIFFFKQPSLTSTGLNLSSGPYQIIELFSLFIFAAFVPLLLNVERFPANTDETEPLLSRDSTSTSGSADRGRQYHALTTSEAENGDKAGSDSDSESGSDSDDDEELRRVQKERFESSGGWLGYLKAFKIFIPYLIPRKNLKLQIYVAILFINIIVQRALKIMVPRQLGIIIDKLWEHGQIPYRDIVLWSFLAISASNSCGVGAINEMIENRLAAWSRQELTYASLDHVMSLSMSFHDQKDSGEVIKAVEQASSLNELLRLLVVDLLPAGLDVAISLWYVMYLLDIYATFVVAGMMIAFIYATYKISMLATVARRVSSRKERDESKLVYESVSNWFTISCFNHKMHTMHRLSRVLGEHKAAALRNDDLYTYIYFFQEGSEHLGQFAVTILAAHRVITGRSSVGELVTLESYWETITWPLYVLSHDYRRMNSALVDAERLLQLFQEKAAVTDAALAQSLPEISGEVSLRDVTFAYEGREPTLHGITLTAQPGQTVAFVGETGSGKSTLLKLIMRFYDVTSGSISIDGHDIASVTLDSLRNSFGFVPQDCVLFNMSILENVRYGRLDATDKEVFEACKAASIHDKILSLPSGYASEVGERGVKLSGGERQRIAIARVFLKNAPIVLLDEATSAMDSETESRIQGALKRLTKGKTTFVIAHRLSTVVEADKILVVSEGRIVEEGRHHELLERGARYSDLWTKQTVFGT